MCWGKIGNVNDLNVNDLKLAFSPRSCICFQKIISNLSTDVTVNVIEY